MNTMILGKGQYYSLDTYKTKLNNNVLVTGASGSGKTRNLVTPNLLLATGSYIVSDPKGSLYDAYGPYLKSKGYTVKKLDFTDPANSCRYNFFRYIHNSTDIMKIAHMLIYQDHSGNRNLDPFWDESAQLLVQAILSYLKEDKLYADQNLQGIMKVLRTCQISEDTLDYTCPLDIIMDNLEKKNKNSEAVKLYRMVRCSADKTFRSILITIFAKLGAFDTPELRKMMKRDDTDFHSIGSQKTAFFVVVSDTDRSMDPLADLFFSQAMNELCLYADKECGGRLPVPVRFFLDDFATNCRIADFPRMIASIRSREISVMLMIQAESQLEESYDKDAKTIIGNCDTYVYLGCNDVDTAKSITDRCDIPVKKVLYMPLGSCLIFRRGQAPITCELFNLENMLRQKGLMPQDTEGRAI